MFLEKMERRTFLKWASSAFAGLATGVFGETVSSGAASAGKAVLEYRTLGKTGLKVTTVGMGVMNCSDPAVLLRAFDLGVNFFDTADCYMRGRNEEMVGKAFQGKRDKVFIQTKVHAHDEKQMRDSVERSLKRLRTDYLDVLVWHDLHREAEITNPEMAGFMEKMKKEGKARFTGFSAHGNMASLLKEAGRSGLHDVALVSYNFTHAKGLKEAVALAARAGIGVVAMKTQAGGYKKEKMEGLNPHQAALRYVLRDPNVATAVPGVTTLDQIEECAAVMGTTVSWGDRVRLAAYGDFLQGRSCTLCGGCTGECPHGVSPGDLLRAWMYHDGYGNKEARNRAIEAFLVSAHGDPCAECSSCSVACRRGLDVKERIEWVRNRFASEGGQGRSC
jgi:uncharacterized protein